MGRGGRPLRSSCCFRLSFDAKLLLDNIIKTSSDLFTFYIRLPGLNVLKLVTLTPFVYTKVSINTFLLFCPQIHHVLSVDNLVHPCRKLLAFARCVCLRVEWPPYLCPAQPRYGYRASSQKTSVYACLTGALLEATAAIGARSALPRVTVCSTGHAMLKGKRGAVSVAQCSKARHLRARGVTTDPVSIPGCITTVRDWESHRAAHS